MAYAFHRARCVFDRHIPSSAPLPPDMPRIPPPEPMSHPRFRPPPSPSPVAAEHNPSSLRWLVELQANSYDHPTPFFGQAKQRAHGGHHELSLRLHLFAPIASAPPDHDYPFPRPSLRLPSLHLRPRGCTQPPPKATSDSPPSPVRPLSTAAAPHLVHHRSHHPLAASATTPSTVSAKGPPPSNSFEPTSTKEEEEEENREGREDLIATGASSTAFFPNPAIGSSGLVFLALEEEGDALPVLCRDRRPKADPPFPPLPQPRFPSLPLHSHLHGAASCP